MVRAAERPSQTLRGYRYATLLINPVARGSRSFDATGALALLRANGVSPRLAISRDTTHALEIARESVERGDDLLFVVGGDGSARLVAPVLAGSSTALATLRGGTANVWAHEMGIPSGMAGIEAHLGGQVVEMDLGVAGDEHFLLMASAGWDAEIAARVREGPKRLLGPGAYVLEGLKAIPSLRPAPVVIHFDGTEWRGNLGLIVLGNTRLYGSVARLTPDAVADDGLLDVMVAAPANMRSALGATARLALSRGGETGAIHRTRARAVRIDTPGLAVQLDGDVAGETPMTFSLREKALLVNLPAGELPPVFGSR